MSMSSDSTLYGTSSSKCNADLNSTSTESTPDILFQTLHNYIRDKPCLSSTKAKLSDLVIKMKKEWDTILIDDVTQALNEFKVTPRSVEYQPPNHWQPDHGIRQMGELCRDLLSQNLFAPMNFSDTPTTQVKLQHDYIFTGSVGMKSPVKQAITAAIGVPATPEVFIVTYPGRRVRAIAVGYCAQFDSQVFFAVDGRIYLVEFEQLSTTREKTASGMAILESEITLDSDWRTFASM
jgi:hypothetical protein